MSGTTVELSPEPGRGYIHDALLYESTDELIDVSAPFLLEGLAAGDAAVIAASRRTAGVLLEAVGDHPQVQVLEPSGVYRQHTPAAIATFRRLAERHAAEGARQVRVVGEVDFGRTAREWIEWQRYEAVINEALAPLPLWGLCIFDARRLPEPLAESTRLTHPNLVTAGGRAPNPEFTDPARYLRGLPVPPEPLEETAPRLAVDAVSDFFGLRHAVRAELEVVGSSQSLIEDFLLAVNEVASNAARHGRPPVGLRLWTSPEKVVCSVSDRGAGFDDPFAGYGPVHSDDLGPREGMGLWLARQLCDHVDIAHHTEGVTVRLTASLR
ncbi:MAG TPA: sensor histidine kinase [Geodermatophilus sp.]|nr:sensor histidine kinase [Geodermatophilus sp.]